MSDPTREEMLEHFEQHGFTERAGYFDFDREIAIYWFANDWHGGQASNLYSALCQSEYTPGPMCNGVKHEGIIAEDLYNELEHAFRPL